VFNLLKNKNYIKIVEKVLIKTGLFKRSDLEPYHLKGSGIESFLLASYAGPRSFYLYNEESILLPPSERDVLGCPPIFLRMLKRVNYTSYPLPEGLPYLFSKDELLDKIIGQDKYVFLAKFGAIDAAKILELYRKSKSLGVDPLDVLVVEVDINPERESSFDEYLAGVVLRNQGYLVSSISLWQSSVSICPSAADIFAYRAKDFSCGVFLLEIAIGAKKITGGKSEEAAALVEAEAQHRILGARHGLDQVKRYLRECQGYFGKGFVSASLAADYQIKAVVSEGIGIITFNEDGDVVFRDSKDFSVREKQSAMLNKVSEWVRKLEERAEKCYLFKT